MPVIGFLNLGWERSNRHIINSFRSALTELGYTEGENIRVLYRFADGSSERLSGLTAELVSLGAKIIVVSNTGVIRAAHNTAPSVPIVSWAAADPIMMGWAQTLARPGGMITGLFQITAYGKPLEVLKEVLPQATTFGILANSVNPGNSLSKEIFEEEARALGLRLEIFELKEQSEFSYAFKRMRSLGIE